MNVVTNTVDWNNIYFKDGVDLDVITGLAVGPQETTNDELAVYAIPLVDNFYS